jgi:tight adherence protein B
MPGLFFLLFLGIFGIILVASGLGFKMLETRQQRRVEQVLKAVSSAELTAETTVMPTQNLEIVRESSAVARLVDKVGLVRNLDAALRGAALGWRVESVLFSMVILAAVGAFIGSRISVLMFPWLSAVGVALALGGAPVFYIYKKRAGRMVEFEGQFPEALDFVSRSVRAGHALSISLEMLANEAEAPLGPEFRRLTNELNLGTPFDVGLRSLADRVPLVDVRFFVSAVLLQRETGGNLTEILASLATLIRSRFRLKGQVKAMSSQGRITALVLTAMPILLGIAFMVVSPDYLPSMARDPTGRYMILGAVLGQLVGYFIMKRIVNIKV